MRRSPILLAMPTKQPRPSGFRQEGGSITFVENKLPPVELEKLGNIQNISEGLLNGSDIAMEVVGCKVVLKINASTVKEHVDLLFDILNLAFSRILVLLVWF